jgi:tRNA pseudouridine38-40 synthase
MQRYKITISYDGTNYAGWQVQDNAIAIQPIVQKALETVLRHPADLTGSGRTDAGVHALGQTAHFDTAIPLDFGKLLLSLNALLPKEIRVQKIEIVPNDFHARYHASSKIYHYHLHLDPITDPFTRIYRHHVVAPFDQKRLRDAIPCFLGAHDFTSFASQRHKGARRYNPVRTMMRLEAVPQEGGLRLEFEADGFLYKMVRNITGTLLDIAAGKIAPEEIAAICAAKDRRKAGFSAPPQGLFLIQVNY